LTKSVYLVVLPLGTYEISISNGRVIETPPELDWLMGRTKAEAKRMIFQRDGRYEFKEAPVGS
jgi:hypothetical protein